MDSTYQADVMQAIEEWKKADEEYKRAHAARHKAELAVAAMWKVETEASRIEGEKRRRMNAIIGIPDEED